MPFARGILEWLESWGRELRFAGRTLVRAKGFSLAVICTLGLCLGPNAAIFSVLYSLILRPLPFPGASHMVFVSNVAQKGGAQYSASLAQYQDFRAHADLFDGFAMVGGGNATLEAPGAPPLFVEAHPVTVGFFRFFGLRPVLGRFFVRSDAKPGNAKVAVVAEDFWRTMFDGSPSVIGREIRLDDQPYTIVGVVPRRLGALMRGADIFYPYAPTAKEEGPARRYAFQGPMFARLKLGVAVGAGQAQLNTLEARFRTQEASPRQRAFLTRTGLRIALRPATNFSIGWVSRQLWMMEGGALLVLLIACVNVINLLLSRANVKAPEFAIRVALGAGRTALLRPMLAESLLLVGVAVSIGLGLAFGVMSAFNWYLPIVAHTLPRVTLNPVAVGAVLVAAFSLAGLMSWLPFALVGRSGWRLGGAIRTVAGSRGRLVGGVLVVAQVALATTLLLGAGLLLRSYLNVINVNPGFDAADVVEGRISLTQRYHSRADRLQVQQRIRASLRTLPGAEIVAMVDAFPVGPERAYHEVPFSLSGSSNPSNESRPMVYIDAVSPSFFATMGIRLLAGRGFTDADNYFHDPVLIVDNNFVRRYFPHRIAVGQLMVFGRNLPANHKWSRIVGVAERGNFTGRAGRDGVPFVYVPMAGIPSGGFDVLVRSSRPPGEIVREIRGKIRAIDPGLPFYDTGTLANALDGLLVGRTGLTLLLGIFTGLALLLAAVGSYGVLAYDVSQRTREIGIRGAIGASRGQIVGLILRQGLVRTGVGLVLGVAGALYLTRFLKSQLFDVSALDPVSYALVVLGIVLVPLLASWLPARRAAKVDPLTALRAE